MPTIRQEIFDRLCQEEMDARDISQAFRIQEKEVYQHLAHIKKTTGAKKMKFIVIPSGCQECGFVFNDRRKLHKPSRCPKCKNQRITPPRYLIRK